MKGYTKINRLINNKFKIPQFPQSKEDQVDMEHLKQIITKVELTDENRNYILIKKQ